MVCDKKIKVVREIEVVHEERCGKFDVQTAPVAVWTLDSHKFSDTRNLVDAQYWLPGRNADGKPGRRPETKMNIREAFRLYSKAVSWSILVLLAVVMEAYGKSLIGNFYALPAFEKTFGTAKPESEPREAGEYSLRPAWQTALQNGQVCGEIFGLFLFGFATDHFGYKRVMVVTMSWLCCSILLSFLAQSLAVVLLSQIFCGLSWGVLETMAATYAADILPVALRGVVLSNVNMCWLIGQLISATIVRSFLKSTSSRAWQLPLAMQWTWAVPLLLLYWFAPESPWWLVRHARKNSAYHSLLRLTNLGSVDCSQTIAMMAEINETEIRFDSAQPCFRDCFRGTNFRRTLLAAMVWVTQAMCGSTLTGYAPYFYEQAGMETEKAFSLSMGMYAMGITGNMVLWALLQYIGRRKLFLWGLSGSSLLLLAGGFVSVLATQETAMWTLGSLVIFMTFVYDMTIGPVCYVLVTEIPSTRLRLKTVVIARATYNLALLINNVLAPRMISPVAWDWKGRTCFFFAGTCLLCLIGSYLWLPETRKLGYIEMDILFSKNAPAKKFKMFQQRLEGSGYVSVRAGERMASRWHGSQGFA